MVEAIPTATIGPTSTLVPTAIVEPTPDVSATVAAVVQATITTTPTPTPTPSPAPSPPLRITLEPMTVDRVLHLRLTNVSEGVISDFELLIGPKDRSGGVVRRLGEGCFGKSVRFTRLHPAGTGPPAGYELLDEAKPGIYDDLYIPVEHEIWATDKYIEFDLQGYETATQATFELLLVRFQDGKVWKEGLLFPAQPSWATPTPTPTPVPAQPAGSTPASDGTPVKQIVYVDGISISQYSNAPPVTIDVTAQYTAGIQTNLGTIVIDLFADQAPVTVNNFIFLANDRFYDGVIFHRVIPSFMIQGGDPTGTGSGGPGYRFRDEIAPGLTFDQPGKLAMANAGPGTNGSQFFITTVSTPHLNGAHTIFGQVAEGQDFVNAISFIETGAGNRPSTPVVIQGIEIAKNP